jgi:hypothetical protein
MSRDLPTPSPPSNEIKVPRWERGVGGRSFAWFVIDPKLLIDLVKISQKIQKNIIDQMGFAFFKVLGKEGRKIAKNQFVNLPSQRSSLPLIKLTPALYAVAKCRGLLGLFLHATKLTSKSRFALALVA